MSNKIFVCWFLQGWKKHNTSMWSFRSCLFLKYLKFFQLLCPFLLYALSFMERGNSHDNMRKRRNQPNFSLLVLLAPPVYEYSDIYLQFYIYLCIFYAWNYQTVTIEVLHTWCHSIWGGFPICISVPLNVH